MSKFMEKFRNSACELKSIKNLAVCGILLAMTVSLGYLTTIPIGNTIKIGFSFLPSQIAYMLFGPVVGAIYGGMADILNFIMKPTGIFFPGFTISAILSGLIYGMFYYKKPVSFVRIFAAQAVVAVFVNILLHTYWLSILLGKGFIILLPSRVLKNVVMLPINSFMFYTVIKVLKKSRIFELFESNHNSRGLKKSSVTH